MMSVHLGLYGAEAVITEPYRVCFAKLANEQHLRCQLPCLRCQSLMPLVVISLMQTSLLGMDCFCCVLALQLYYDGQCSNCLPRVVYLAQAKMKTSALVPHPATYE